MVAGTDWGAHQLTCSANFLGPFHILCGVTGSPHPLTLTLSPSPSHPHPLTLTLTRAPFHELLVTAVFET
jgi:hypothetical protein